MRKFDFDNLEMLDVGKVDFFNLFLNLTDI